MSPVDVVILTWNDGLLLRHAVDSVLGSVGVDARIIIVDNGSDDALNLPSHPSITLIRNDVNRGVAGGRNQGVQQGSAPYVLLLDSDARLVPDALAAMLTQLIEHPDIAVIGPVFVGQRPSESGGAAPTFRTKVDRLRGARSTYVGREEPEGDAWDVDVVIGACQCIRRSAYDRVNGIDERYFYGPEDVDFCMRLRNAGWRVQQLAAAKVHHPPRRRNRSLFTRRGVAHAWAVTQFLWRHRGFGREDRGFDENWRDVEKPVSP